jgi:hypothetical protein
VTLEIRGRGDEDPVAVRDLAHDRAAVARLADAVAPMAPAPLVPDASTFEKLITVSIDAVACDNVAVTAAPATGAAANARQISLVNGKPCSNTTAVPVPATE